MRATRRRILQLGAGLLASPLAAGGCAMRRPFAPAHDLTRLTATEAVRRMRTGALSAVEYAEALRERPQNLR
jgi:hypothetical protein